MSAFLRIFVREQRVIMKQLLSLLIVGILCVSASAKPKARTVYMFGIGVSFTDSVAYLTEVQPVTPAYIESATGFLYDRSLYALQLRNLLEETYNLPNTTCVVMFSRSQKKMDKKREKMRKRFMKDESLTLMRMPLAAFKFFPEEWDSHETTDPYKEQ